MSLDSIQQVESKTILEGDVLQNLAKLPARKYNVVVTSPPYLKARNYGIDGQWGLEKDPQIFLDRLAELLRALRRVITDDGSVWVNLGDTINDETASWYGIPEEFLVRAIRQGWKIISRPVWRKRNIMPSSTKRRFTMAYENVYGLAKNSNWYFNLDAVKVPLETKPQSFNVRVRDAKNGKLEKKYGKHRYTASEEEKQNYDDAGIKKQNKVIGADGKPKSNYEGFNERYKRKMLSVPGQRTQGIHTNRDHGDLDFIPQDGKNPRDYWEFDESDIFDITVKPKKDVEHYATFPPELPERIIKACCPIGGWVLDPFMGSGTTGLVAEKLGLNWNGIELNPEYIKIARSRIGLL